MTKDQKVSGALFTEYLKPKNQTLTVNADDLKKHFITTANHFLKSEHLEPQDILKTLEVLPDQTSKTNFNLQYITYEQVEEELKDLRLDCSAGYDNTSVQHVKSVYENLVSPLTHIINSSISENLFPIQWKMAKINPIPKSDDPQKYDDYCPVTVLPLFSKVYERLIAKKLSAFLERSCTLKDNIAGFRKLRSANILLMKIRDDILSAMSKGELTLSVYSDYSKDLDAVQHHTIIQKLPKMDFSTAVLKWFIRYLGNRSQYVQANDSKSATKPCHFGVPQGPILGSLLLNLYVNHLQDIEPAESVNPCQYVDDTTQ